MVLGGNKERIIRDRLPTPCGGHWRRRGLCPPVVATPDGSNRHVSRCAHQPLVMVRPLLPPRRSSSARSDDGRLHDAHRGESGVEPICRVLQFAPSTDDAAQKRRPPSARAVRDAALKQVLLALWRANPEVYGAHKLWKTARRPGHGPGTEARRRPGTAT